MFKLSFDTNFRQRPSAVAHLVAKKVNFGLCDIPFAWYRTTGVYMLLNAVTMFLPVGERFFIDSVLHFRDRIEDSALQADIAAFVAQEAAHSRQHELLNRELLRDNPWLAKVEKLAAVMLKIARCCPARWQLAITCALEHFTAMFSHEVIAFYRVFSKSAHPAVCALWGWHAAEELEHKAVCFDVYQQVAGGFRGYVERCLMMVWVTLTFLLVICFGVVAGLVCYRPASGAAMFRPEVPATSAQKPPAAPNNDWIWLLRNLLLYNFRQYLAYFSPGFHPWNLDDSHLVEAWRASGAAGVVSNGGSGSTNQD